MVGIVLFEIDGLSRLPQTFLIEPSLPQLGAQNWSGALPNPTKTAEKSDSNVKSITDWFQNKPPQIMERILGEFH